MQKLLLVSLAAAAGLATAPVCRGGYVNRPFVAGQNLFANPLQAAPNNLLSTLFFYPPPEGTRVSLWNPTTQSFGAPALFQSGNWSANYLLAPGTGALLVAPTAFINTFVGAVLAPDGSAWNGDPPVPHPPAFSGPDGVYLLSCKAPLALGVGSPVLPVFDYVIGRAPHAGEQFTWLDEAAQAYHTTTFTGGVWDHGNPVLGIGRSANFNLGPVPIPEPSTAGLLALSLAGLLAARPRKQNTPGH